jgi:hypothetical protein
MWWLLPEAATGPLPTCCDWSSGVYALRKKSKALPTTWQPSGRTLNLCTTRCNFLSAVAGDESTRRRKRRSGYLQRSLAGLEHVCMEEGTESHPVYELKSSVGVCWMHGENGVCGTLRGVCGRLSASPNAGEAGHKFCEFSMLIITRLPDLRLPPLPLSPTGHQELGTSDQPQAGTLCKPKNDLLPKHRFDC